MPEHVRGILAVYQLDDLATLAVQADIVKVMKPHNSSVDAASSGTVVSPTDVPIRKNSFANKLDNEKSKNVHELYLAVEALTKRFDRAFSPGTQ